MKRSIVLALGFLLTASLITWGLRASPAQAEAVCGDRSRIMATLAKNYAERPAAIALTSDGAVIEVLLSAVGSWSIIVTKAGGPTCLASL